MYDRYIDFTFDFGLCRCKLSDMPKDMMLAWTLLPIPQELKYRHLDKVLRTRESKYKLEKRDFLSNFIFKPPIREFEFPSTIH